MIILAIVEEFVLKNGVTKGKIDDKYVCHDPVKIQQTLDEIGHIAYEALYAEKVRELQKQKDETA